MAVVPVETPSNTTGATLIVDGAMETDEESALAAADAEFDAGFANLDL